MLQLQESARPLTLAWQRPKTPHNRGRFTRWRNLTVEGWDRLLECVRQQSRVRLPGLVADRCNSRKNGICSTRAFLRLRSIRAFTACVLLRSAVWEARPILPDRAPFQPR